MVSQRQGNRLFKGQRQRQHSLPMCKPVRRHRNRYASNDPDHPDKRPHDDQRTSGSSSSQRVNHKAEEHRFSKLDARDANASHSQHNGQLLFCCQHPQTTHVDRGQCAQRLGFFGLRDDLVLGCAAMIRLARLRRARRLRRGTQPTQCLAGAETFQPETMPLGVTRVCRVSAVKTSSTSPPAIS